MNNNDKPLRKKSVDFRLRLQPLVDSPEAAVLSHLNSLGSRSSNQLILQVLRTWFLPFAYQEKDNLSDEKLKKVALEACNALEQQIIYIRQVFFLEKPTPHIVMMNGQNSAQAQPLSAPEPEPVPEPKRESLIKGVGTYEEAESLFGDM
ncbi:hypothetical protein Cri9333_4714 (plasmid) [Crinalium epipsammum PCC 9333]|uniref:Uncharacterized protein n=1 Tax=Crinalium epipsammum PCC 9333 TaxID=1173022 RepID=K9W566_9CYAN|nr:hypothetical protein [Crinalium epipsammum]AFZ15493.1 hypothetical protein Cri9333_4714 [Crinalium epipsammum PCC 9333]